MNEEAPTPTGWVIDGSGAYMAWSDGVLWPIGVMPETKTIVTVYTRRAAPFLLMARLLRRLGLRRLAGPFQAAANRRARMEVKA